MTYTVAEAAKAIGKSKAAVFRAISKGKLSATREEARGIFLIDPTELHRVFPPASAESSDTHRDTVNGTSRDGPSQAGDTHRFAELQGRLTDAHQTIDDLRRRLDQADTDRRQALDRLAVAQERIAALLTDQRPAAARRSWWRRLFAAGAVVVMVVSTAAWASDLFGDRYTDGGFTSDFYATCASSRSDACAAYVAGISDAMGAGPQWTMFGAATRPDMRTRCIPKGVTAGQELDAVLRYMAQPYPSTGNPRYLHNGFNAVSVIGDALAAAYPGRC